MVLIAVCRHRCRRRGLSDTATTAGHARRQAPKNKPAFESLRPHEWHIRHHLTGLCSHLVFSEHLIVGSHDLLDRVKVPLSTTHRVRNSGGNHADNHTNDESGQQQGENGPAWGEEHHHEADEKAHPES